MLMMTLNRIAEMAGGWGNPIMQHEVRRILRRSQATYGGFVLPISLEIDMIW